ncbi:MAG: Ig-like domain-containing protein, partial [Bacteroidales bacterium]|nr:Ig-like domain-containing protein [Bacteroidales bacterium]
MRKFILSLVMGFSVVFAIAQPAAPTIAPLNGETLFTIEQEYQFQATAISGSMFGWSVSPTTGYEELEGSHISDVFKVKFTVPGTYVLSCTVYDGQSTSEAGTYEVEVTDGTGTPQLTYSVDPISVCADGSYYEVHVFVSGGEAEQGTYQIWVNEFTAYEAETGGSVLVFPVPLGNSEVGTYDVFFRNPQHENIATTTMTVTAPPSAPTITVSGVTGGNYMVGESYSFAANGSSLDEYEWIVSSKNSTGYEFVGSTLEQTTSIKFTEAGDYTIKVVETSNGCSSESELQITVHAGSSQQITYTAEPATLCTGDYMSYGVSASDVITSELELKINQQTFTGYSKGDNVYIFDLSGLTTPGTYNATVVDVTNNNTVVATSVITVADGPELPTISSQETTFTVGGQYVFSAISSTSDVTYMWGMMTVPDSPVSPIYEFVDGFNSQSTTIKFNAGGTYIISCHTELNGCSSSEATYNVTVDGGSSSQSAFETIPEYVTYCINGSNWDFRIKATSQISSSDKFYMEDLDNSHSIMGTVSNNAVIFNISEFAWTEGSYSVKITDSQSNQIGSSNITITSEGPSVLVANWNSTFVVGQPLQFMNERYDESATYVWSIVDTDEQDYTVRTAGQMAYITFSKAGTYTVKCTGYYGSPECSNEDTWGTFTVVEETLQDITYAAEPQSFCYNEDSEGDFEVTASEELDGGSYNLVVNGNSTYSTDRTDGDKIYFELSGIPAGTYDVEVWNGALTKLLCSSTLTIVGSDSDFSVQGPETGVLNEAITYTITNPTADMTYTWAVEMYGGDYNSPADEGSYFADSFDGTSFTVTFLVASEDYRITCFNTCGTGTELALNIINPEMYACKDTYSNTYYESLSDALDAMGDDYNSITLLKDIEENRYVYASKNLTLDLNGYTATIKSLSASQSLTISNGTFNGMINGEYTNSSSTLQIDNATVNSIPSIAGRTSFFWNAENVSISNNGTLEVQDSAYFGCDEGFSLNIDATSQVVLNGSTLITASTDTTTVLNEIRKYLPDGYTATALDFSWECGGHSIVLSPDANVTLRPAVRAWFEETNLSVMIGDSVQVCLHVEADDPNFDIENCAITFGYGEGEVQFIPDPENPNCTYVKALPGASGSIIGATLVYNGTTYYPSNGVMVRFEERPVELVCPATPLAFEDGSYELQINEWCDIAYHTFKWASDDESVATVDQLGNVTFVKPGDVTISCTSTYNYDDKDVTTATCPLSIEQSVSYWATDTIFCQGQSGRVTIESNKELNLESFGVQDENGNAVSATVSQGSPYAYINYSELQTGVYYITSAGKQVASFHVIANSLPDASFDCPTDAVEGGVWNVTAAKGYYSYYWSSDGISFPDDTNLSQEVTFETAGPVWVALHVEDEFGCVSNDTCRFTIAEGPQTYSVNYNGKDEINWCHGAEGGHVAFTVASNKDIPESLTVNHDWASNVQVTVYGKEASIEFDYPYAGRQGFQLITINDDDNDGNNDTTIVVENVNAYGYGYLQANIDMYDQVDTVVNFAESQEITLEVSCLETLDLCTSCGWGATFSWSYDEESIDGECLEWVNPDTQECNKSKMKFTFSQAGTYTFEAQTHQNGCSSEWTSKTIYVVPFDRSLFSLSPEVDTIEIGDADGIQFTLNYDGEPYSDYTLKSDGDVTIDANSVYDNEVVGTYEIQAVVSGLVVATARLAVVPVVVNYTVADVEMCQDQEDVVATISADRSIYGRSVTVRDEQDNTYFPEYNDNNDAAFFGVSGLNLGLGTYTFRVYDNDEYKTEFNVTVHSLPRANIECPVDPVVGDTWTPNTAMAEGLTYHWWSENISSLDGTTSCCPTVTFTEAGSFSATLVVKDNETGCLSEGATCEFTVGEKAQEYFLNCPDGDLSLGESYYVMFLNAGDATGKTLTWSTSDEEIVSLAPDSDNGQCVVNFKQVGTAQIYCQVAEPTGEVLEMVACTLNIVQPKAVYFSQGTYEVENGTPTTICLTAEGLDLTNAQITYEVSNDKILSVEPSAAATGCAVLTSGVTTTETLSIVATIVVGEETYEATADVHVVEPFVCEGQKIVGGTYIDLEENNFVDGDNYRFKMIGTSNFDGNIIVHIREYVFTEETQSVIISSQVAHEVYKGQEFSFYDLLEISNVVEAGNRAFKLYISPMPSECPTGYDEFGSPVCYGELCQTYYALAKEEKQECSTVAFEYSAADNNYIYSADGLAYEAKDGDKFNVSWTATSDFSGTINLALIDKSAGANYWQEVSSWASIEVTAGVPFSVDEVFTIDGLVSTSPEIALFATVNDQVDGASFCMTNFWFHKLGDIVQECTNYELDGENSVQLQYVYNGDNIAVGDTYNYEVFGTAQFTGDLFFSLVDQSEEVGYWDMLADSKVFSVVEGERFEIKGAFTVAKEPTSSYPGIYFTVGRIDANQSGEIKTICVLNSAIYKANGGDECYSKIYVDGDNSTVVTSIYPYQMEVGDVYEYYISGTADFTGEAMVSFTDVSEEVDYYFPLADIVTFEVTEGESFSQRGTFTVTNLTSSEYPEYSLMIGRNNGTVGETSSFCIENAYIERQIQSFTMSKPELNMFVGGKNFIYVLGDGQPYNGDVEWGVTDLSGSTTPCVTVDYGEIYANSEGQAKIYAKVHDQIVATAIVTVTTFSCDGGELYTTSNNNDTPYIVYPLSGITAGDSYKVTIDGKTDYDGVLATAVVDFSSVSEDDGPAQGSNLGEIMVKAGQEFSYNTILTVVSTDASAPEYKMILLLGGSEELDEFKLCATQLSVEKFTAQYTIDGIYDSYMFVGETKQLTIKNIDGTVYGGNAQWISTDENVVAIGNDGYVYAKSEGVAEVQVIIGGDIAATTLINVERATGISIGLDKPGYEIANVGDEQIVYINASGLQAATFTYQYDESIIEVTPIQGTNSLRVKGLKVGSTHLFVTATLDGESYEAGAVVEVGGGSTSNDYTLAFAQSKYEITEGESISACLTIGEGFKHFDPQFTFDQTVISISDPIDGSDCGVITGLKAGQTFVEVIAEAPDGKFYSAQTEVIVNAKYIQDDYKLSFEQETYEVYEGETIETCLIIGRAFEHGFQPTMSYDETIITVNEPTAAQSENCGSVTGVKEGTSLITLDVEKEGTHYTAKTHIVVLKKNVELPQMAAPVVTTEMVTLCYSKNAVSDNVTSLDEYVEKSSTDARLKWYDAAGNALTSAPIVDAKTAGKRIYHVSQIASGYNESEKVALAVNIIYVAAPELNIYEQKVCDNTQTQAFVAKSQNNEIYWYQGEGNPVAQNTNTFMPTEAGTYLVRAIDVANGCVSDFATVSYAVGNAVKPEIQYEDKEYALGETVALAVQAIDEELYSVVWKVDGSVYQGTSVAVSFAEEGGYMIPCTIIEKSSGCSASDTSIVTVKNLVVPVTSISVEPGAMELYTNEKGHFAVSFEPAHATNQRYVVTVADTSVAVVSGATVIPVGAGETTLTVSSAENGDISASVSVKVTEYVAARSISVPKIVTMAVGESTKISASVLPSNASKNKVYFMEKSDSSVVKVSADGTVVAKGEGTAVVNSYTEGGLQAVTVVYVTSNAEEITSIEVPERVAMKVGDSVSVPVKVTPTSLLIKELEWTIEDNSVASYNDGVLKALKKGETTLSVSYKGISETVTIVVNASSAPSVTTVPQVVMNQDGTATVDLSMYVTDEGGFGNLTVTPSSDDFTVTVEDGKITIRPADPSYVGTDTVSVVVTNGEGLSAEVEVPVTVQETENKAPVVKLHEILFKEDDIIKQIDLSDIAEDDMTDWSGLKYTFSIPRNGMNNEQRITAKVMKKTQLRIVKMLSFDQDSIFVSVSDGVNTTLDTIIVYVGSIPNKAPVIAEIPVQNETDESVFGTIDLTKYVTDDYTTPAAITWTTSASENISVAVANGVAGVTVLNEFWRGAEAIKFYAKDEEGAMDSAVVYYVRNVTIKTEPEV